MFVSRRANRLCTHRRGLPLLVTLAAIAGTASFASSVKAQNYPWCSNFADGAGTNCGFTTEAQCRMAVQGSGGYCDRNTQYRPPEATARAAGDRHERRSPALPAH